MPREDDLHRLVAEQGRAIERLGRIIDHQDQEIAQLRRELRAAGLRVPEVNPAGRTSLSPEALLTAQRRSMAHCRAAKRVGPGKDCVGSREVQARMRDLADDAGGSD